MDLALWSPTAWAALGAWATFAIYVVIVIYAVRQVGEARRLREEQARPWVVVDFEPGFVFHIIIENIGRTVARNVSIRFEPPLTTTLSKPWAWEESTLLTEGFRCFPRDEEGRSADRGPGSARRAALTRRDVAEDAWVSNWR